MPAEYDFIIVGSGAGGGPLACNLALAKEGYRVALVEAGTDPALVPGTPTFFNYAVPGLYTRASEDPEMSWEFFVQHYTGQEKQKKDTKYFYDEENEARRGIFYPRAAALGGCTSHHAMITLCPHRKDWEELQKEVDDPDSWSPDKMRQYFERIEDCQYLPRPAPPQSRDPVTGHGFGGWLPTSMPDPTLALGDDLLTKLLYRAFIIAYRDAWHSRRAAEAKAHPPTKGKQEDALLAAVGHLLQAAQRASGRLPGMVRSTVADLRKQVEREQRKMRAGSEGDGEDALLNKYLEAPEALLALFRMAYAWLDPNRVFANDNDRVGPYSTPASVRYGVRAGVRERILAVRALYPDRLHIIANALVTKVLFKDIDGGDGGPKLRAWGVDYIDAAHLDPTTGKMEDRQYRASPPERWAKDPADKTKTISLRRDGKGQFVGEVILAGGAFNTPQLLMLSGVGDSAQLQRDDLKITPRCHVPGVGLNLQDRYEVTVVLELPEKEKFKVLDDHTFLAPGDPEAPKVLGKGPPQEDLGLEEWVNHRGVYATNGAVLTIIKRSKVAAAAGEPPDLFIFGLPGNFRGYKKGYSLEIQREEKDGKWVENHRRFTWAILKGRTRNHGEKAGTVTLRSANPVLRPRIHFKYFEEGEPEKNESEKDLRALVEGVHFALRLARHCGVGPKVKWPREEDRETDEKLAQFIKQEAWGHHACGTCRIGKDDDPLAVLDGDFRVRGVKGLRVVDASVFPRIPGFFIVTSIYMISEKASDVILEDRRVADGKKEPEKPPRKWPGPPVPRKK
jgi:choline dehydrogenase